MLTEGKAKLFPASSGNEAGPFNQCPTLTVPQRVEGHFRDQILHELPRQVNVFLHAFGLPSFRVIVWIVFLLLFAIYTEFTSGWSVAKYATVGGVIMAIIVVSEAIPAAAKHVRDKRESKALDPNPFPDNHSMLASTLAFNETQREPAEESRPCCYSVVSAACSH